MRIFILINTVYFNSGSYNMIYFNSGSYNMIYFNIAYIFIIVYLSNTAVLIYSAYECCMMGKIFLWWWFILYQMTTYVKMIPIYKDFEDFYSHYCVDL